MATLVKGGAGFIGVNIVKVLAERGHHVVSLDISPPDGLAQRYLEPVTDRVTWVHADILDTAALDTVSTKHKLDKIVHAAVYTARIDAEVTDGKRIVDINVGGTANLLELARRVQVRRFVYVSSGGVYGDAHSQYELLREDALLDPRTLYAATKYSSELIARRYAEVHGFQTASVRLSGPYGPMERLTDYRAHMSSMYAWTARAVRGAPIELGSQATSGDLTYVLDIAVGIAAVLDAPALRYDLYNLSRGQTYSREELVVAFQQVFPEVQFTEPVSDQQGTEGIVYSRGPLDTTRIRGDVGFTSQYDLVSGLREYIGWWLASGFES